MDQIREYLISITATALICSAAVKLINKGMIGAVVKLIAGIIMVLAVVAPWLSIRLDSLQDFASDIRVEAGDVAAEGENSARQAMAAIITGEVRTYILEKAESLGVELTVEVELREDDLPVPDAVRLQGQVSPYAKSVLTEYIAVNLGIAAEDQIWIS